ncbi:MAG: DUF1080 domain-containing protein [Candidatus Hydrogenedentes bacterium]|nr:DUF1080 domain-containing protein [Candidatus Hydrogenedentota bacterium]
MDKRVWAVAMLGLAVCAAGHAPCAAQGVTPPPEALLSQAANGEGFQPLFKDDLSDAQMQRGGWEFANGELASQGRGDIWTKERYGDFVLDLEFKCDPDTNSGVFLRCDSIADWLNTAIEVQILQPNDKYPNDKWHCGAIFDCLAPAKLAVKGPGEWNRLLIIAKGSMIYVQLNGEWVASMNLDEWTARGRNPDGTPNKFKNAYKDMKREGYIGLQYHGQPVWFRNMRVKPLAAS